MVLTTKRVRKVLSLQFKIAFVILVLVLIFYDYIRTKISPPVMDFVSTNLDLLKFIVLFIFVFGAMTLILIVWLLEWGDKQQKSIVTKYVSQLVCTNYYGNYRKTNVYKAIKTALSKFSRNTLDDEENDREITSSSSTRAVNIRRFSPKSYTPEYAEALPTEDTSDGSHTIYYPNGKIEKEVNYKNNKLDGIYRTFYEDGTLHQERHYKEGKLDGLFKANDEYGVPYFDIIYREGKQEGITNIYYKNGALQYRDTYVDGKRVHRDTYSESGELKFSQKEDLL